MTNTPALTIHIGGKLGESLSAHLSGPRWVRGKDEDNRPVHRLYVNGGIVGDVVKLPWSRKRGEDSRGNIVQKFAVVHSSGGVTYAPTLAEGKARLIKVAVARIALSR